MPAPSPSKVAFLFLLQSDPLQLKIWEDFLGSAAPFVSTYAHCSDPSKVKGFLQPCLVDAIPTTWGDLSLVRATLRLIAAAYQSTENEFFALVSESCIPIMAFTEMRTLLLQHSKSVCLAEYMGEGWISPALRQAGYMGHLWKQSQWMILTRRHVKKILDRGDPTLWNEFPVPDEAFFISTLSRSGVNIQTEVQLRRSTWTRWLHPRSCSPMTFDWVSAPTLSELTECGAFFARKISEKCCVEKVYQRIIRGDATRS